MSTPPLRCHLLIGPPGSGKSTLATQLQSLIPQAQIIATDRIRADLYGDAATQGDWPQIEAVVRQRMHQATAQQQPVIYDATNSRRLWRMTLLQQLSTLNSQWIAWYLKTPRHLCHQWNRQRPRQVPAAVIDTALKHLKQYPPIAAEGFLAVYRLNPAQADPLPSLQHTLDRLDRSLINQANRTQHRKIQLHRYSHLLDFDRLLHLISLLLHYPGLGTLSDSDPDYLATLVGHAPPLTDSLSEITAVMHHQRGALYANPTELAADLAWLDANGFTQPTLRTDALTLPPLEEHLTAATHPYADTAPCQRLLTTIRFILHQPFQTSLTTGNSLTHLVQAMQAQGLLYGDESTALRKDIEKILKPYQLLPPQRLKRGYFMGTGILSATQLIKTFTLLESQAKHLDDPIALDLLETFKDRLQASHPDHAPQYPVRAIYNRAIVNSQHLPASALVHSLEALETDIEQGRLLELNYLPGVARFHDKPDDFFLAWPLQIVFYNIAWYLGYEIASGPQQRLLQFERLDRLFRGRPQPRHRHRRQQETALARLHRLFWATGSLYLGQRVSDQDQYLSAEPEQMAAVTTQLELWCTDTIFQFISEGTQRFQPDQMRMSPRLTAASHLPDPLFCLPPSPDPHYPHRFQVRLPGWALEATDLHRWILGFGDQVKVVAPAALRDQIKTLGAGIAGVYRD
jgi:predicted kinase